MKVSAMTPISSAIPEFSLEKFCRTDKKKAIIVIALKEGVRNDHLREWSKYISAIGEFTLIKRDRALSNRYGGIKNGYRLS